MFVRHFSCCDTVIHDDQALEQLTDQLNLPMKVRVRIGFHPSWVHVPYSASSRNHFLYFRYTPRITIVICGNY